jgi:hypothetical protein
MAIAMAGIPLSLSIGIPSATYLGILVGWRMVFGLMTVATVVLTLWVLFAGSWRHDNHRRSAAFGGHGVDRGQDGNQSSACRHVVLCRIGVAPPRSAAYRKKPVLPSAEFLVN